MTALSAGKSEGEPSERLEKIFEKHKLAGMSVLVVYKDSVIFESHHGLSNIEKKIPVDDSTLYRVASISKVLTALAFMQLEEKGLVSLDDDISELLGYKVQNPHSTDQVITPRMLLSHTSTLKDGNAYNNFLSLTYGNPIPPNIRELINREGKYYADNLWLQQEPGQYFNYSNLGYGILGTIIEKVSQTRFDVFVKENILDTLKITGSFNVGDIGDPSDLAVLYRKPKGKWTPQADYYPYGMPDQEKYKNYKNGTNGLIFAPQGGLRINARDLAKIMIMLMDEGKYKNIQILKPETLKEMYQIQWLYNGMNGNTNYNLFNAWGLGIHLINELELGENILPTKSLKGHSGEAYGLISDMYFHENPDFGFIFITNGSAVPFETGDRSSFYKLEEEIAEYLYENHILTQPEMKKMKGKIQRQNLDDASNKINNSRNPGDFFPSGDKDQKK
ncbi:MAG: serine hydrolase domain-containing protein [Bacteroidota bacterium]